MVKKMPAWVICDICKKFYLEIEAEGEEDEEYTCSDECDDMAETMDSIEWKSDTDFVTA